VVAEGLAHHDAAELADRIVAAIAVPLPTGGAAGLIPTASVGVAVVHGGEAGAREAIRRADDAMYAAKADGGNRHRRGTHGTPGAKQRRLDLERGLRGALERGEFRLVAQPVVHLENGLVRAAEALLRWTSAELGPVPPDEFIGVAEEAGMMDALGAWVLREACRAGMGLQAAAGRRVLQTVNVSPRQLRAPGFADTVADALRSSGMAPDLLVLEITETALLGDDAATVRTLAELGRLGVSIVLDDFGTGYSSLSMLKDHPIDGIKIDRSFVAGLPDDLNSAAIVAALVGMAQALGRRVVAEGIETRAQAEHLRALGCDGGQGYHFARPMPFDELREQLRGPLRAGLLAA
jgi:EAL domain-containing protein (putative c-di-GMP-specific phosphodiesterase class I)